MRVPSINSTIRPLALDATRDVIETRGQSRPGESEKTMDEKSHVSMEQHVCLVCGQLFDTGAILLDRRLRPSMEHHTVTGWDLCPEHRRLYEEGLRRVGGVRSGKERQSRSR